MACGRTNCSNILCDRVILNGSYYICDRCWKELVKYKNTWIPPMTRYEIEEEIERFMCTDPENIHESIEDIFDRLTNDFIMIT